MENNNYSKEEILFNKLKTELIDKDACVLAEKVKWLNLEGLSKDKQEKYPVAIYGKGSPVLLIHGFDSCFLEFRRLAPLLINNHQLIIPDLFGFGFCPRPQKANYGKEAIINHLICLINKLAKNSKVGVIGASMGGAVSMELARQHPNKINRLLLLAPAGLTGTPKPIPPILDQIGVWFLSLPEVRKGLCKQAFADPIKSVSYKEEQIASIHIKTPGWKESLASFARKGGLANCGRPLPSQPFHAIWGANDRILKGTQKEEALNLLRPHIEEINNCGHLPHLDQPQHVAKQWLEGQPIT